MIGAAWGLGGADPGCADAPGVLAPLLAPAWILADHDRRELAARGYEPAPSLAWMLLLPPIVYLIARRRVGGPGY